MQQSLFLLLLSVFSFLSLFGHVQGEEGTCDATTQECHDDNNNPPSNDNNEDKYGETESTITHCLETEQTDGSHRVTYNTTTFAKLRHIYRAVQADYEDDMMEIANEEHAVAAGIVAPFAVQTIPGTQYRGVFATQDLPQGTRVWSPLYLGAFYTEEAWLAFLDAIAEAFGGEDEDKNKNNNLGKRLVCDALQWSYVMEMPNPYYEEDEEEEEEPFVYAAVLDLDEGSFVNHGWWDKKEANILDSLPPDFATQDSGERCESCMYAVRDIAAGEQILCDYTQFYEFGVLEWYEASVAKAWDVDRRARPSDEVQWHYR